MNPRILQELDSPLVWFAKGAAVAVWFRKNPNSRLFWFVAGVGTTVWLFQSSFVDPARWRARIQARREERIRRRQSEIDAAAEVQEATTVTLNELVTQVEALRSELAEVRSQQQTVPAEEENEHHVEETSYTFT